MAQAYSEITYSNGTSDVTTQSKHSTLAADALTDTQVSTGKYEVLQTIAWNQNDEFITELTGLPAAPAAGSPSAERLARRVTLTTAHNREKYGSKLASPEVSATVKAKKANTVSSRNMAKYGLRRAKKPGAGAAFKPGRTHAPALRLPPELLKSEPWKSKLDQARAAAGAKAP